jgi:hypothetical protein
LPAASNPELARIDHAVFTKAACDLAWRVFSEWEHWPRFSDHFSPRIQWQGQPWACGSRLISEIVHPVRAKIDRIITMCAPPRCVAWVSYAYGFSLEQCVLFEPYAGGGTKITIWIEFSETDSRGNLSQVRSLVQSLLERWFGGFCAECDRRAEHG